MLQTAILTYDSENNPVKNWTAVKNITGDLQPKVFSQAEIALYGVDIRNTNAKVFYFDNDNSVVVGARLGDYEVLAVNVWPKHSEAILRPV
jgi:hypothetical protein